MDWLRLMKNNFLISTILIFIFSFSFNDKVKSEELQFNANEIQSVEKGNKIIASKGFANLIFKR